MFIGQCCKVVMQVGGKYCLAFNGFFLPINWFNNCNIDKFTTVTANILTVFMAIKFVKSVKAIKFGGKYCKFTYFYRRYTIVCWFLQKFVSIFTQIYGHKLETVYW
jgi:hypothetical protein